MWSCGVIMHMLLIGAPPFYGKTKEETIELIKAGKVDYSSILIHVFKNLEKEWTKVPEEAKSLIKEMLEYVPEKRITAGEALKNAWIKRPEQEMVSFSNAKISLKKLKNFKTQMVLQKAVLAYFATIQLMPQEEKQLQELFASFDFDHDGILSESDIFLSCQKYFENASRAKIEAETIIRHLDLKKNGCINFMGK